MKIACVGSRDISLETQEFLSKIGKFIAFKGWVVVSGNALGSDISYAKGANAVDESKVWLHLPWRSYNKEYIKPGNIIRPFDPSWKELAQKHHPIYDNLSSGAQKMMDRNVGIISESDVVLAVLNHSKIGWGGTWHGWRVAEDLGKPRLDVINTPNLEDVFFWLEKQEKIFLDKH